MRTFHSAATAKREKRTIRVSEKLIFNKLGTDRLPQTHNTLQTKRNSMV